MNRYTYESYMWISVNFVDITWMGTAVEELDVRMLTAGTSDLNGFAQLVLMITNWNAIISGSIF